MFQTPTNLRRSGMPRESFSHEKLLEICRYYKNLLYLVKQVQNEIDEVIDKFQHTQYGRPSEPLKELLSGLALIDAGVKGPILEEIVQVELAMIKWEGKSAKLRSEAKRQARYRADKAAQARGGGSKPRSFALDGSEFDFAATEAAGGEVATDESNEVDSFEVMSVPPTPVTPQISPTFARALQGMKELPTIEPGQAPGNESYKKSGLV